MCTLSWLTSPDGYTLYFNRDERRTRARAEPPFVSYADGAAFVAARDPEGGGTWLAVNEHGVALALLNLYDVPVRRQADRSRGLLVLENAGVASLDALESRICVSTSARHRPFQLIAFAPAQVARCFTWDGSRLRVEALPDEAAPVASSSVAHAQARASRRARHAALRAASPESSEAWLARFHTDHAPEPGALSACVHREDAVTVSLSRVRVDPASVEFAYAAGAPCRSALGEPVVLRRG